jgi:hypothetical protein
MRNGLGMIWFGKRLNFGIFRRKSSTIEETRDGICFGKPSGGGKTYNPQKTTGHKPILKAKAVFFVTYMGWGKKDDGY